jgi:hypothetical protein
MALKVHLINGEKPIPTNGCLFFDLDTSHTIGANTRNTMKNNF